MAQGLSSLLGGLAQGFTDLGKSTLDVLGGGATNNVLTAGLDALINKKSYGQAVKDANQRQKDFRKWLYETESDKDAAAKGLGTALNGAQTAIDLIPGLGQSAPVNAIQGAIGGLADEFKFNGENYDWGKGAQRAAVGAGAGLAAGGLGKALANSGSKVLSNGVLKGAATGSLGGALSQAGGTAIEGGNADQILQSAAQGAQFGALLGAGTGGVQSLAGALKKTRAKNSAPEVMAELAPERMSDSARAAEIKKLRAERRKIGPEKALYDGTLDEAQSARWSELYRQEEALKNGYDSYDEYFNTLRSSDYIDEETLANTLKGMSEPQAPSYVEEGSHTPVFDPELSSLASSMNKTVSGDSFVPDDFYEHMNWYGGGDTQPYIESEQALRKIKGDPNAKITVYRATVGDQLNPSDWVTLSPTYAKMHLNNALRNQPGAKIIKETVRARDLRWPGDDINEFGYYPITNGDVKRAKTLTAADMGTIETSAPAKAGITRIGSADVAPVDPSTLPKGWAEMRDIMNDRYMDDITSRYGYKSGEWDKITPEQYREYILDAQPSDGQRRGMENYLNAIKDIEGGGYEKNLRDIARHATKQKAQNAIELLDMPQKQKDAITRALSKQDPAWGNERRYVDDIVDGQNDPAWGYNNVTSEADAEFSDRLGIGRSNTLKQDYVPHEGANGQYLPEDYTMAIQPYLNKNNAVSTVGHERLHSFQFEAPEGRYDKRVTDAYNELSKDLKPFLQDKKTIRNRYKNVGNTEYWGRQTEQEARMLQQYLDNKGFTKNAVSGYGEHRKGEWGEEINPAFDKFFDKLRELSKKGVALPAILAALGLGEYATENQEEDKDNGQQI